ncbi:carbohydrate ABC transporter permease, partial [Clostridium perfringens]
MKTEITPNMEIKNKRKRILTLKKKDALTGWLFVSPALIGFSIFTFGSIIYSFYLSLTDYNLMTKPKFVGLENYIRAFTKDDYFYKYFGNTLYFVVFLVPIVLIISLL